MRNITTKKRKKDTFLGDFDFFNDFGRFFEVDFGGFCRKMAILGILSILEPWLAFRLRLPTIYSEL